MAGCRSGASRGDLFGKANDAFGFPPVAANLAEAYIDRISFTLSGDEDDLSG